MGLPSGNFSSTFSGRLQVTFSAEYLTNSGSDWGSGALDIVLRGYVGASSTKQTTILNISCQSAVVERDYVGGSGDLPVGMELVASSLSGPSSITAKNLRATCVLIKR